MGALCPGVVLLAAEDLGELSARHDTVQADTLVERVVDVGSTGLVEGIRCTELRRDVLLAIRLVIAVLPVDERSVEIVLDEERGAERVRPRSHGGVGLFQVRFPVVEAVGSDWESAGGEGAALKL